MRKWKIVLCAILMLAVASAGLYALGGRSAASGEPWKVSRSGFNPSSFARAAANYTISILTISFNGDLIAANHPAVDRLQQHTGYRIRLEYVLNANYAEQMNTRLAANDLPGLVAITGNTSPIVTAAQSGAFWDITEIYDLYPNLARANKDVMNNISIGGRYYGIYRERVMARGGMVYRSDWLANLGLSEPKTLTDLYNILRAFTLNDPDRNGVNDTYGMTWAAAGTPPYLGPFNDLVVMHGGPKNFGIRNGRLTPYFEYDEFFQALDYSKRLYDEGLINRDFAALPTSEWTRALYTGRAGWHMDVADEANRAANNGLRANGLITQAQYEAGEAIWVMGSVANSSGQMFSRAANPGHQGYVAISTTGARTLQDLHYYLDFLDKTNDEIGQNLLIYGAEDVNYRRNANGSVTTIPSADIPNGWQIVEGWNQFRTMTDKSYLGVLNPRQVRQEEVYLENARIVVSDPTEPLAMSSPTWAARSSSLNQIIADAVINYIMGNINRQGFDRETARWYSDGGQTSLNELQAAYDAARR
jgi:putative aldouronate transport system substrate-binding protein